MAKKENYSDMMVELEKVLLNLENDDLNIEEAMKEYERGSKLVNKLYKTLNGLEGKFITIKENSEVVSEYENN